MNFDYELVGKIGSMALIDKEHKMPNYTLIARLSKELVPGYIWVSSGATEIGRLDYIARTGKELLGDGEQNKADYSSQGQAILMSLYREFINPNYSVRQVLVEHQHFNDEEKRNHLKGLLLRAREQNAVPIINYNDAVCNEENRKLEIKNLSCKASKKVVECVDNDETAAQISCLVKSLILLILTSVDGIYSNINDENSLIKEISGKDADEVILNIEEYKRNCHGTSRAGSNGAGAKLEYIKDAVMMGTRVIIANAKYSLKEILSGSCNQTIIGVR